MTDSYAVVGDPVAHSLSPVIQQAAFDAMGIEATYSAIRVATHELAGVVEDVRAGRLAGANVTMPHKHAAYALVDRAEGDASRAESVNTLIRAPSGVIGLSTDIPAIRAEWTRKQLPAGSVLVLGAGGAAAAAMVALEDMDVFASARSPVRLQALLERLGLSATVVPWATPVPGAVIVNATPIGMHHESFPPGLLAEADGLFDMAYGSLPTPAVVTAKSLAMRVVDGLDMLVAQAALSFEAWTGTKAPLNVMLEAAQIAQGW